MDNQPKVLPQTASQFFYDGSSMRQPVPGTIAIGGLKEDVAFFTGKAADGQFVPTIPVPVNEALVERGHQRYSIYCQPCHDARGDGKGILFQRANVPTASFHQEKILKYPDGQIFDVITNGAGLMSGYRWPIPPADRWAIVAYVRSLEQKRLASAPARPRAPSEGGTVTTGGMNGATRRKLLILFGPVVGLAMFVLVVWSAIDVREPQRIPGRVPGARRAGRSDAARRRRGRGAGRR